MRSTGRGCPEVPEVTATSKVSGGGSPIASKGFGAGVLGLPMTTGTPAAAAANTQARAAATGSPVAISGPGAVASASWMWARNQVANSR